MATESLIVELDAKTQKLDAKLKSTDDKLNKLDSATKKNDESLKKFTSTALTAATALTAVATAVTVAAKAATNYAKDIEIAATRSNETVEAMQGFAFAANTVGISLEKLGDIGKDTQEKLGEFLATGGGGFQDFVDVIGATQIEAQELAREFQTMSSPEVLQAMVTQMELAGVSASRMSFALEGMASDTTDLIPLLKKGGEEAKRLSDEFFEIGETLTQADIDKLKKLGEEFDKLGGEITAAGAKLAADFSDEIITAIALMGTLTQTATGMLSIIGQGFTNIGTTLGAALFDALNDTDTLPATIANLAQESKDRIFDVFGEDNNILNMIIGNPDEALERWRRAQEEISLGINKQKGITVTAAKEEIKWEKLKRKEQLSVYQGYIKAASILGTTFLEDNKALNAGLIVADTAAGVMKALATSSNIYEGYANAAVVIATGAAQLSNLSSASKGGGSVSGAGESGGGGFSPQQQSFEPETSSLEVTEQSESGSQTINLVLSTDDGNTVFEGIANGIQELDRQGR